MNYNLPVPALSIEYLRSLNARLKLIFINVNSITKHNEATTAPTTGKWKQSNIVWNSAAAEAGITPNKYVITGWICTVSGEPGTWVEMRTLTGN